MEEGSKDVQRNEICEIISFLAAKMTEECFENYALDSSPKIAFSTFIFAMIDKWHETHGISKDRIPEFLEAIKKVGADTYEEERRSN